jgi:hypothetical protein
MAAHRTLAALALLLGLGPATAADFGAATPPVVTMAEGECGDSGALSRIKSRFAWAERNTWHRGFTIATIGNARPSVHPFAEPGLVKRDYCRADAVMTDGTAYQVFYVVEHGMGFASLGNYVDFCVLGLDPWHVHDGDCRTVR